MELHNLINLIKATPGCIVFPVDKMPTIKPNHIIPPDLENFYQLCGEIQLFKDSTFPTLIVSPNNFVQANPIIFANVDVKYLQKMKDDISWSWYLVGTGPNSQYITIDLSPERLGNVYNSFWINHPRDSFIIASSFTDLLLSLIETKGEYYPWDMAGFVTLGNPYQ